MPHPAFAALCKHYREVAFLGTISSLLDWDERCYLPAGSAEYRAEQLAYLAGWSHRLRTDPRIRGWLDELQAAAPQIDPHSDEGTVVRRLRWAFDRDAKLPQRLVEELARARSHGQTVWVEARQKNEFASFLPALQSIVALKREQADALGHGGCRYDALLEDYEPGAKTDAVRAALDALRRDLVPLVRAIADSSQRPPTEILERHYPRAAQETIGREAAGRIGFDFHCGRLDVTHHPFCTTVGPRDVRITTRYDEQFFPCAFFGTLHEAGHGIYEQGLRPEWAGLPPGEATSLGMHESQSRLWENFVGRGAAFWQYFFPAVQSAFPAALGDVAREDFLGAVNAVRPSLIRVEADEATYNLHIIIRFELEQAILADELPLADLPAAWNAKYREYLGIEPPNDSDGVLQDVHWSAALLGYFPTYSLGNMHAAQIFAQADRDLGGLSEAFARGEFLTLRDWLREKIHRFGQCYTAHELTERISGQPLSHRPLIAHLRNKLTPLYRL